MRSIQHDGKTLYRIDVEQRRTAVMYVLATDEASARDDAEELASDVRSGDWDEVEDDIYVMVAVAPPAPGTLVWTGGEGGEDMPWPGEEDK